jgi:hypothetical protein
MSTQFTSQLQLNSERLRVEIARPDEIRGARWNRGGFVTQVTLDDRHTFCGRESAGGSDGVGLCGEFGITIPVGFDSARAGDWFPKPGIGLLRRRDDAPYDFMHPYEVKPFPLRVEESPRSLRFISEALPCRGYAFRLEQTISIEANYVHFAYDLENTGEEPIETHEYRHNFLNLDGDGPGPKLSLHTSFALVPRDEQPAPAIPITWEAAPREAFMRRFDGAPSSAWWEMRASGISVRETVDAPLSALHLWGAPDVVSPEAFVDVRVAPGQSQKWRRDYVFSSEDAAL